MSDDAGGCIHGWKPWRDLVMEQVRQAGREILIATHRLEFDAFGQALLSELEYACQRGLTVRLLLDAEGSAAFIREHPVLLSRLETVFRIGHYGEGSALIFDTKLAVKGLQDLREDLANASSSQVLRGEDVEHLVKQLEEQWSD